MKITFDANKNAKNIQDRGLSFEQVAEFDFDTAVIWQDVRQAYPEQRFIALGLIQYRVYSVVFSDSEDGIRVISFRKANAREVKNMSSQPNPELIDADNPEWTDEMFGNAMTLSDLPTSLQHKLRRMPLSPVRINTDELTLDASILNVFKATGQGWQARINDVLRQYISEHPQG
jgi:uncharacterized DUF497 family protein